MFIHQRNPDGDREVVWRDESTLRGNARRQAGKKFGFLLGLVTTMVFSATALAQQPVNSATGVTLFPGGSVLRSHAVVRSLSAGDGGELDAFAIPFTFSYGIHPDLTIGLAAPYVRKEFSLRQAGQAGALTGTTEGFGDLFVTAKYRYLTRNAPGGRTIQLGILGGVKLPTGETDAQGRDGRPLPLPLQVGTGSVDFVVATTGTGIWDWRVGHFSVLYRRNSEGDRSYRFGDFINYNLATSFRVYHATYPGPELYLGVELNGEYARQSQLDGVPLADTGGNRIFVSPSLVFFLFRNVTLESSVQLPVVQDLNGAQLEDGTRFVIGLRFQYAAF